MGVEWLDGWIIGEWVQVVWKEKVKKKERNSEIYFCAEQNLRGFLFEQSFGVFNSNLSESRLENTKTTDSYSNDRENETEEYTVNDECVKVRWAQGRESERKAWIAKI